VHQNKSCQPEYSSRRDLGTQVSHQTARDIERLSIEMNYLLGNPRPWELLNLVVYLTELHPGDFETSGVRFGRQEFLVKPTVDAVERYLRSRPTIKSRLLECHECGLVRGATW
jgi:hypothetical protein